MSATVAGPILYRVLLLHAELTRERRLAVLYKGPPWVPIVIRGEAHVRH